MTREPNSPSIEVESLVTYVAGQAAPAEIERINRWLAADRANAATLGALRQALGHGAHVVEPPEVNAAWERLERELASPPLELVREWALPRSRRPRLPIVAAAAALVLAAGAAALAVLRRDTPPPAARAAVAMREMVSPRGQRAAFVLGDGTRVMLDADSRLQVPGSYLVASSQRRSQSAREVILVGRAFFQVAHDSSQPFRVRTRDGVIEDLGTDFVVTAFPEQRMTQVVVAEGTVAVRPASASAGRLPIATLTRGGMATMDSNGLARLSDRVDVARYLAWTEGRHLFKRARLAEAIAEIERSYDVEITVLDSALLERRFTAAFGYESLGQVLDVLAVALKLDIEQRGRVVTLRRRESVASKPR